MYLHYFHTAHATETWTEPLSSCSCSKKIGYLHTSSNRLLQNSSVCLQAKILKFCFALLPVAAAAAQVWQSFVRSR
jgi:hypothetical protein